MLLILFRLLSRLRVKMKSTEWLLPEFLIRLIELSSHANIQCSEMVGGVGTASIITFPEDTEVHAVIPSVTV